MSFIKSSRKRTEKVSSDSAVLSFDLLSNLTYMAALATGGPSRDVILELAIKQNYQTGVYFRQVYVLAKRLGFEYTRAFRMVSRNAKASTVKNLLLRFAGAISSGVSEAEFLAQEARVEREQYINAYHRSLETLTKWGDAYAALLVSVSLVVVVAMISTMLSNIDSAFLIMLIFTMSMVTGFGIYIIYRTAPYEIRTYQNRRGPIERQWAKRLFVTVFPAGVAVALLVGIRYGFPAFLLIFGFSLLPTGIMAWLDNRKVNKLDQEVATFIRSMGNVTAALSSTLGAALEKLDRRSLGTLEPYIRRLQVRLGRQINSEKSWDAFRDEVGSELMNRASRTFVDGVTLGGPPDRVGAIAAEYALDSALMRARRAVTAAPFAFLTIPLHFAMTALMVFVLEIMDAFNTRIIVTLEELEAQSTGGAQFLPTLPIFQPQDMGMLTLLTAVALTSMTIGNALAPKFALGGHPLYITFFGAITCIMTGLNMLLIPQIASKLLAT